MIILGGSDRRPANLPEEGRDKHPISGYKGVDIRIDGQALIDRIVEQFRDAGGFGPFYVAGPASAYGERRGSATVLDTNAGFGANIQAGLEIVMARHPGVQVGFTTCDILPEPDTLRELTARLERESPCDLWFPLIRVPEDRRLLGASRWKPDYGITPADGEAAVRILPGHLVVADPAALRLQFLYRLFHLGYQTRNRPIGPRRRIMVRGSLFTILGQDLADLVRFRVPDLTWAVLADGIRTAGQLRAGNVTTARLESTVRKLFVRRAHRKRYPRRRVILPIIDELSLARDIDTLEEAQELGAEVAHGEG